MHILGVAKVNIGGTVYSLTKMWASGYVTPPFNPVRVCFRVYDNSANQYTYCTRYMQLSGLFYADMGNYTGGFWSVSSAYKTAQVAQTTCYSLDSGTIAVYIHNCNASECYNVWPSASTSVADYADYMQYIRQYGVLIVDSDAWKQICPYQGVLNGWIIEVSKSSISPTPAGAYAWLDVEGAIPGTVTYLANSNNWNGRFLALDLTAISL